MFGGDPTAKSKNPTPRQIALLGSLITGFVVLLTSAALMLLGLNSWVLVALVAVVATATGYVTFLSYLRRYIYRKIKLVYKTIHSHKLTPEEKSRVVDVREDIIEQVEEDVSTWMQEQNQRIEELKRFDEYRQRFLGDISHELKTPIFNIQGYLETLIDGAIDDEQVRRRYVEKAARNVERLNTIVSDLESISRLEDGRESLEMERFSIRELAEEPQCSQRAADDVLEPLSPV